MMQFTNNILLALHCTTAFLPRVRVLQGYCHLDVMQRLNSDKPTNYMVLKNRYNHRYNDPLLPTDQSKVYSDKPHIMYPVEVVLKAGPYLILLLIAGLCGYSSSCFVFAYKKIVLVCVLQNRDLLKTEFAGFEKIGTGCY
jgi:hypothetical protein